ncbi:hypothetical protein L210DRAFT_993118 [Boletus edulis BED1]|uniref:Uncharacterized protein n=1 Tax=Boletus edulis BED1 TaxID=1328754 RepID=A0AAD4GJG0_BOLED|nr:hypothetical protein L210DRAFT_993118 [Boletus edulis BED1]
MTSSFAGSFAPYTPPPDDPSRLPSQPVSRSRIWFSQDTASYQSGGLSSTVVSAVAPSTDIERGQHNDWETTYGLRVDVLAAFAYVLGPISAFVLLVLETHNDYVRFHAYQAALLMTPLLTAYILAAVLQFPSWICSFLAFLLCLSGFSMATQAFLSAFRGELSRYDLPKLGSLADQWVDEE